MNTVVAAHSLASTKLNLPTNRGAYYGGKWHESRKAVDQVDPGTGESLGPAVRAANLKRPSRRDSSVAKAYGRPRPAP
jgi:hypothetical protein